MCVCMKTNFLDRKTSGDVGSFSWIPLFEDYIFLLYYFLPQIIYLHTLSWGRVCSIFSGAGIFCVAHGLGQLTRDVQSDFRTINFSSDVTFTPPTKNTE